MHNSLIKIFENSPIKLPDRIASKLASLSWLVFVIFILLAAVSISGSGLEVLGATYGIIGVITILLSSLISPLFGLDNPYVIGVILLYATMTIIVITLIGLVVLIMIGLAKKKLFVWRILDVVVMIQVLLLSLGVLINPSLNRLIMLVVYVFILYLLYSVRRFFK